jgi:prepilin-type N-terminal cleavage/methylation domain-containing protein
MKDRGFTLMEVLVAMSILCVAALGSIQLVTVATGMLSRARADSLAATLAASRMEQLRALRFDFDNAGLPVTDLSTDLSIEPARSAGPGLAPSGGASLDANVGGYADFLDRNGGWLGGGTSPPPGTAFVRRWSIENVDPAGDLIVVQVLVRPVFAGTAAGKDRVAGEARFVSLRARTRR